MKTHKPWTVDRVHGALSVSLRTSPIVTKKVLVTALRRSGVFRTCSQPTVDHGPRSTVGWLHER